MPLSRSPSSSAQAPLHLSSVTNKLLRGREFSQTVSHHVLGDEHIEVGLAVVDTESETHHLRRDLTCARPCANYARSCGFLVSDLLEELVVHIWSFLERARHECSETPP